MTEAQSRLPALYGENLCLAWALNSLDYYLRVCKKFQVFSDHQALCSLYNKAQLDDLNDEVEILCRQTLKYCFEVLYVPGKDNILADFLSRNPRWSPKGLIIYTEEGRRMSVSSLTAPVDDDIRRR